MKKVFLDNLPKYGNKINWNLSVGHKVKFIYDDINGEIEIIGSDGKANKLLVKYGDKITEIMHDSFRKCYIRRVIGLITSDHKFQVGYIFDDRTSGKLQILDQIRIKNINNHSQKAYIYKCLICGNEDTMVELSLVKGNGCAVCANQKVLKNYNDLWTTNPEVAKLLKYPDNGYKVSRGMARKDIFICPNCNKEQKKIIQSVVNHGLSCVCGDGISYPEKFVSELLNQLNVNYIRQKTFDWGKDKKYDFFIKSPIPIIIETHGIQHYERGFEHYGGRTLVEEQENDRFKEELAKENRFNEYLVIDCRYSELEWIKNNILKSKLNELFDLSDVDWLKCHEYACNSLVKEVCDLWESGIHSTSEICKIINLNSTTTIVKYLKQGTKLGWCNYDGKKVLLETLRNNAKQNKVRQGKSVVRFTLKGEYIDEFSNISEASKLLNISTSAISHACQGKQKYANDYIWMYKEDYVQNNYQVKNVDIKDYTVLQLSLNGEYIQEFNSIKEASNKTKILDSNIFSVVSGKTKTAGGFKWVYKDEYEKNKEKYKFQDRVGNVKEIVQLTLDCEFIKEWDNMTEPSKKLGIGRSGINHACLGNQNSSGGFRWMYKEDYEKMIQERNKSSIAS